MSTALATRPATPNQIAKIREVLPTLLSDTERDAFRFVLNTARENGGVSFDLASKTLDRLFAAEKAVSEKQVNYLSDLLAKRDVDFDGDVALLSRKAASALIEKALAAPARKAQAVDLPRHGHYAVEVNGDLRFLRISTTGKVFRIAGPAEHETSPARAQVELDLIKADPRAAAVRYGQEIGRCGRCHTRLSVKESRDLGLGPDCASKGW